MTKEKPVNKMNRREFLKQTVAGIYQELNQNPKHEATLMHGDLKKLPNFIDKEGIYDLVKGDKSDKRLAKLNAIQSLEDVITDRLKFPKDYYIYTVPTLPTESIDRQVNPLEQASAKVDIVITKEGNLLILAQGIKPTKESAPINFIYLLKEPRSAKSSFQLQSWASKMPLTPEELQTGSTYPQGGELDFQGTKKLATETILGVIKTIGKNKDVKTPSESELEAMLRSALDKVPKLKKI